MQIHIIPTTAAAAPAGKLADAEILFADGLLAGMKLVGFGIWEGRNGRGRSVTFPARQYSMNGERRTYILLRGIENGANGEPLRERILQAYADREDEALQASAS